jgi:hypothetical protein
VAFLTIEECRSILGADAEGRSDEEIERLRDALEGAAVVMYDEVAQKAQADPEGVRWMAYAFDNPDDACDSDLLDEDVPTGGPNLMDFTEAELSTDSVSLSEHSEGH